MMSITDRAQQCFPSGVNSPVRAFEGMGIDTPCFSRAVGPYLIDYQGHSFIDYIGGYGPAILGHGHQDVVDAIIQQANQGLCFGATHDLEIELAEAILGLLPQEQLRFVNSGTEAAMTAIRLARGYTNRDYIIKFSGGYHGHVDALLVQAGSGAMTHGMPSSRGIPAAQTTHTLIARYNDIEALSDLFERYPIAAVIVEPIAGNMNMIHGSLPFLQACRHFCDAHDALLIADEVMTGFRIALGGAQAHYAIEADLVMLGKIIGGGLPAACLAGSKAVMGHLAPAGPVYQAGTLSGNRLAMASGLATIQALIDNPPYEQLESTLKVMLTGIQSHADRYEIPLSSTCLGGMFGIHFSSSLAQDDQDAQSFDQRCFGDFFRHMWSKGIAFAPSVFEAGFISIAHDHSCIERTIDAFEQWAKTRARSIMDIS